MQSIREFILGIEFDVPSRMNLMSVLESLAAVPGQSPEASVRLLRLYRLRLSVTVGTHRHV